MIFALIDPRSNRVCELGQIQFDVAAPLFWVPVVDPAVNTSYSYVEGQFVAPGVKRPTAPSSGTQVF